MLPKSIFISYLALISLVSIFECEAINTNGFTTNLIHRDSPESPSYDHSSSPSQRLVNSLKRSAHRAQRFEHKLSKSNSVSETEPELNLISWGGEYLMKFSIGTPPVPTIAIADTGSDVVWTQCRPCLECFNQTLPFFSPRNSTSYKRVACTTPLCKSLNEFTHCSPTRRNCLYDGVYGDGSFTSGILATETFTFASASDSAGKQPLSIPNILFGCGFRNGGIFSGTESGIVGLGGGKASFITQLGFLAQGKFSYCLLPITGFSNSSKLHFGAKAEVLGRGVVSTPLVVKKGLDTFYFLTMEGISIGNERMDFPSSHSRAKPREGNMIIDSGTTLTLLPSSLYKKMVDAISRRVKLKRIQDPNGILDLCYTTRLDDTNEFPDDIVVHLRGADLKWRFENGFVRVSENCVCFAAKATDFGLAIYGNLAQVNFFVGYDTWKKTLSFKPTDCVSS